MNVEAVRVRFERLTIPEPTTGCLLWTGGLGTRGYGQFSIENKNIGAHRVAYFLAHGTWPEHFVCHKCDTPACVNVAHLFDGTNRDNLLDAKRKGRIMKAVKTHCIYGHPLSGENLYVHEGRRRCQVCRKAATRRSNERKRRRIDAIRLRQSASAKTRQTSEP